MMSFESIVDQIYEAAADPGLWPQVMHDLGRSADAAGGIILTRRADAWLGWRYSDAMAPGAEAYLRGAAATRSQSTSRLLALNRGGFIDALEAFSNEEEYLADSMMTDWGTRAGLHHAAVTAIPAPTGDLVVVQVNRRRGQPRFDCDDISRLDAFRPHLARAGLLAARWRLERLRAAAEALALIGLPAAILDARGKVLAANALIEAMASYVKWLPKDRLAFFDPGADALLQAAIADISRPAAKSVRSFPAKGMAGDPVVAHLIPATGEARDLFDGGFGVLALTPLAAPSAPGATLMQGLFDLTPAEARVASGVAEGLTPDQIATRQNVTVATIRTQMKSVFAKTGSSRQPQLAALLAAQPRIPLGPPKEAE
ncbi:helix-turn-helix transcriptional regulator [Methylocystis sp. JAN1]|uniref:helix-turn-helix transcriptional regulator n=1 Tax=Methylocystis sp. JAN1 TaxID=3397211 RepID=UPI003FA22CDE